MKLISTVVLAITGIKMCGIEMCYKPTVWGFVLFFIVNEPFIGIENHVNNCLHF